MNHEQLLRILVDLGIKKLDAEVYLFLATQEPKKGREISNELKINKTQLYRSLRELQIRGMVNSSSEYPARFSAVLFDEVLDLLIKTKKEQAKPCSKPRKNFLIVGEK